MIDREDLDEAVSRRLLTGAQRDGLVELARARRAGETGVDEEQFRFLTSFNDVFVTIAIGLLLFAVGSLLGGVTPWLAGAGVAAMSWPLAEYFTRRRRMALPSIALLLTFVGGVFGAGLALALGEAVGPAGTAESLGIAAAALAAAGAAALHWRRFHVPITVAAGLAAAVATAIALAMGATGGPTFDSRVALLVAMAGGLAAFALAMRFDTSDRQRVTRRTDIAFWLHLLAAPLIVHPVFSLTGLTRSEPGVGAAVAVVVVYLGMTLVALAIDRRALLVSALVYVIFALQQLLRGGGEVAAGFALTALVLGGFLVMLSAAWAGLRRPLVAALPDGLRERLPVAA